MNKPGDKNYVDPDKPQPCQKSNRGLQETPISRLPSEKYKEGWDRIWGK